MSARILYTYVRDNWVGTRVRCPLAVLYRLELLRRGQGRLRYSASTRSSAWCSCTTRDIANLLCDFMSELDLVSCDRNFRGSVMFTYERDDGLYRSWIDHVLCSRSCSTLVSDVFASHSGSNLSDHSPLFFCIRADCQSPSHLSSSECCSLSLSTKIDWSRISVDDVDRYCHMVHRLLPSPPLEAVNCCRSDCSEHLDLLDSFAQSLLSTLVSSSSLCFPCVSPSPPKIPGWNDGTRKLREMSIFWHKVWVEAGCPSAGVLFNIKRNTKSRFKYAVRRLKRRKE